MRRLLLVDDDPSNRATLGALFEVEGYDVAIVDSVASARRTLNGEAPFDIVILDRQLGDGVGPSLVGEIKSRSPAAVILLLTGGDGEPATDAERACHAVLTKGLSFEELVHTIDRLLPDATG